MRHWTVSFGFAPQRRERNVLCELELDRYTKLRNLTPRSFRLATKRAGVQERCWQFPTLTPTLRLSSDTTKCLISLVSKTKLCMQPSANKVQRKLSIQLTRIITIPMQLKQTHTRIHSSFRLTNWYIHGEPFTLVSFSRKFTSTGSSRRLNSIRHHTGTTRGPLQLAQLRSDNAQPHQEHSQTILH